MPQNVAATVRTFAPEFWGQIDAFEKLCGGTYRFNAVERRAVAGVRQHIEKAVVFRRLADRLRPGVDFDREEAEAQGFTAAENSRELAAVVEASLIEVYASVDCAAKVLRAVFKRARGLKESTRGMFQKSDLIGGEFPDALKEAIRGASWFERLVFLRDELTHLGAGFCRLPPGTDKVVYMHPGIRVQGQAFSVPDILTWLDWLLDQVNGFHGQVFAHLRGTLSNTPVPILCGLLEGRGLLRLVDPTQPMDWSNGVCQSWQWFEKEDMPMCPFTDGCGAYARAKMQAVSTGPGTLPEAEAGAGT